MRYFLAVSETLHFGRAASQLRIAQPNLSLQIKKIEQALGHPLLSRSTRGVALTPAGEFLAAKAAALRNSFDEVIRTARRIGEGADGTLSIGFSGSSMYGRLPFALDRFRRQFPNVEMQLREMYAHEQQPLLLDGTLDVGFIRDGARTPGLKMHPLSKERFMAVLPQSHRLAKVKNALSSSALRDEPFVLFSPRIARLAFERTLSVCTEDGFTPNIALEAPQWVTIVSLVAAGMGVSIAPESVARLNIPGAVFRPLRSRQTSSIDLWLETTTRNPSAVHLVKFAKEEFVSKPAPETVQM